MPRFGRVAQDPEPLQSGHCFLEKLEPLGENMGVIIDSPVILPPGRAKLSTKPDPPDRQQLSSRSECLK